MTNGSPLAGRRAAYFIMWSQGNEPGPGDGVRKKVGAQIRRWLALGVQVRLFICARNECEASWAAEVGSENIEMFRFQGRVGKLRALSEVRRAVRRFDPAFLYLRQESWLPPLEAMVACEHSVMELNGDDVEEARPGPRYYFLYKKLSRGRLVRRVSAFVAVSHELARTDAFARYRRPTKVIANGIELSRFDVLSPSSNSEIRVGFLGAEFGAAWHGVSKIIALARKLPDWRFELIGPSKASVPDVPPNVMVHGVLAREEYQSILAGCDAAFGTMAAHAKNLCEASPLKVREYLAYGLATINGVPDTDFPGGAPFLLELPNEERNVIDNVERIEAFVRSWKGRRIDRAAVAHLDVPQKEMDRLSFIAATLSSAQRDVV